MNKIFIAASAAAIVMAAGSVPALAQSSTSGASMMPSITCRDLSAMDPQMARNVVFYLGGLNAASGGSSAMNSSGSGSSTSGDTSTTADSSTTGAAGSTTGSSSDTSGSGTSSTTADSGTSGSTSTDTTGSTTAAGSTTSSGSSGAMMAQLPGFSSINADQILSTCQSSPDKQLSEVIGSGAASAQ